MTLTDKQKVKGGNYECSNTLHYGGSDLLTRYQGVGWCAQEGGQLKERARTETRRCILGGGRLRGDSGGLPARLTCRESLRRETMPSKGHCACPSVFGQETGQSTGGLQVLGHYPAPPESLICV